MPREGRPDERRKHLLEYLHLSVEDLYARNVIKASATGTGIAKALLLTALKELYADAKTVVAEYAKDKAGLAAELYVLPVIESVASGLGKGLRDFFKSDDKKSSFGGPRSRFGR